MPTWRGLAASGASAIAIACALAGAYEGRRLSAYPDVTGIYTLCYGHTGGVHAGQAATPAECQRLLTADMQRATRGVQSCIRRPMTPGQEAAFSDFAYNLGWPTFCRSSIARRFNRGDTRGACDALMLYVHAGRQVLPGLVKRRSAERDLCLD